MIFVALGNETFLREFQSSPSLTERNETERVSLTNDISRVCVCIQRKSSDVFTLRKAAAL